MSGKPKKPKTFGQVSSFAVLSESQISRFQEIRNRHMKDVERMQKIAQPIIEQASKMREQISFLKPMSEPIPYHRPVEYDILEELQELNKNRSRLLTSQEDTNVIIYDTKSGSLDRSVGGKFFSYDLNENGKRKKLLDTLLARGGYVQTKELKDILESTAVAKIVQTFNDYATSTLRLKGMKVLQGKKGSGYRINPKIHIEKE